MKKSVLAAALAGVMLFSGCSGVSQDEYNSLLEENSRLKTNITLLENDIHSLQLENATLSQEKESLRIENIVLQDKLNSQSESTPDVSASKDTMIYEDDHIAIFWEGIGNSAEWSNREYSICSRKQNRYFTNIFSDLCFFRWN